MAWTSITHVTENLIGKDPTSVPVKIFCRYGQMSLTLHFKERSTMKTYIKLTTTVGILQEITRRLMRGVMLEMTPKQENSLAVYQDVMRGVSILFKHVIPKIKLLYVLIHRFCPGRRMTGFYDEDLQIRGYVHDSIILIN